ncbi:inner centromere protein [Anopheles moucheti]|uniref:inner centromere protein n=1 Tax=Anopheles moucheti TaxID=186751 RepID=UPI0022F12AD5|nr:inner centromere protein [Anopheles moucheti]
MDEMLEMFNSFIGEAFDREKAMAVEFTEFEKKLNECVTLANERGTPVQNKKRPKRQVSIIERDEEVTGSSETHEAALNNGHESQQSGKRTSATDLAPNLPPRSSARMLDVAGKGRDDQAPQLMETSSESNESTIRPSRTARLKAQEKLKEPTLNSKLRNDGGTTVNIKIERSSTVANSTLVRGGKDKSTEQQTYEEMETENDANQANRIISPVADKRNDEGFSSATEAPKQENDKPPATVREMSLMVIPPVVPKVEIISDEEMPPPSMPPPKVPLPKVRTKKKQTAGVKNKKDANDTASSSAVSSADSTMNSTSSTVSSNASTSTSGRPSRLKSKTAVKQPAVPTPTSMELNVVIEPIRIKTEKLSIVQRSTSRMSDKSTYEDAHEQQNQHQAERMQLEKQMRPLKIALEKMPLQAVSQPNAKGGQCDLNGTYTQPMPADGTFITPPSVQDGTFTVNSPMENAPGEQRCNETFNIPTGGGTPSGQLEKRPNDTFVIEKHGSVKGQCPPNVGDIMMANASIMTEDESVIENSPILVQQLPEQPKSKPTPVRHKVGPPVTNAKPKNVSTLKKSVSSVASIGTKSAADAKKNKELFNPCVMSPIKSRIEAFEKCATTTSKIGTPQAQIGRLMKTVSTPTIGTETHGLVRSAHVKPLASSAYTPNCASQPIPKASSASKVGQMQSKALQHTTRSQSRDSSWDRATAGGSGTLSTASSTSSLLDEKKKKREEKQRLAAAQREAMEREKREHAERLVREKEEKYRKLVHEKQEKIRIDAQKKARKLEEFEKRRLMEEQKTLADQKRDELAKQLAEQQRIDRELLDTLKQNQVKENHEVKLHKQLYQQKMRQQQQQQQAAKKKLAAAQTEVFTFDMIDTDDTTDEDVAEDPSAPRKKKRPPPPAWCQKSSNFQHRLTIQARIDTKVIDSLFSVQPMTPDLRVLFPSIDAQKLKRNSSAIWRTPPRHSQLP